MTFTATPVDGSTPAIPMSSVVPDGTNTPLPLEGGPPVTTGGNTLSPASMYVKDGNDLSGGATTDAAVTGDVAGSRSAKLRGLNKILADVWDNVNHRLHVIVDNAQALGQNTMVNSASVAIASDQSAVKTKGDFTEVASLTAGALNADLVPSTDVSAYKSFGLMINGNVYVGTLSFQGSNDNTNFYGVPVASVNNGQPITTTSSTQVIYYGNIYYRYLRVRMTSYTSGSAQGVVEYYTFPLGITNVNASVSGTVTETNSAAMLAKYTSSTGTPTSVTAAITSTQLLAANANRKGFRVFNESTAVMYLATASAASLTAYTVQVGPNGFYEDPPLPIYTGPVFAIWSAAVGAARITEMS